MAGPRILGQLAGSGTTGGTWTVLYTVPAAPCAGAIASTIALVNVNTAGAAAAVSLAVVPAGATRAALHTLVNGLKVKSGDVRPLTLGVALEPGAKIYASAEAGINVHAFGTEL